MTTDHLERLSLDKLGQLNGGEVAAAIDGAIAAALNDLRRRPSERRARSVTIKVSVSPTRNDGAAVRVKTAVALPDSDGPTAAVVDLNAKDPVLLFNPISATHIDQLPLPFESATPPAPKPRKGA